MMTMSKSLGAGQAKDYYQAEYTNTQESYYTEDENVKGEWFGKQADAWNLEGEVRQEPFEHLCEGQDPRTGLQLVKHVASKTYENAYGEMVESSEHRAGWDATFSAPKSVSLAALVGGDERIMEAHDRSVNAALRELEKYAQARIGGNNPAETTGKIIAAKFKHDAARPDRATGYAAPQLHTHVVIFNLTHTEDDRIKPIQPLELFRSQQYATAIYRTVLSAELQKLGYVITVDARMGAPEIDGFSKEYLAASSPRRQEIEQEAADMKERLAKQGINVEDGAGLRQAAAKTDRMSKQYDRQEMRARHLEMDARFGEQAVLVAQSAQERGSLILDDDEINSRAHAAVTFARMNAGEREAVVDKRRVVVDALRRNMSFTDRVLVNAETTETDVLLNQRMAYVAVSRARFDARPKDKDMALEALKESQSITPAFNKLKSLAQTRLRELNRGDSDSHSIARLRGRAVVAESNVAVAEKRMEDFEKSKHFANFEINGEQWSLVSVDRHQRTIEREIDFNKRTVSAYRMRLYGVIHNPIKLYNIRDYKEKATKAKRRIKQAREEIKQLQPIRERVTEFVQVRREVLRDNVEQERQLSRTLNGALAVKIDLTLNQGQGIEQPEFNAEEVDQLHTNAAKLRDLKMLNAAHNYLERLHGDTPEGMEKMAARAASVEESAKTSLRGAAERIRTFVENREFFPVLFNAADGSEKAASLNELAAKSVGEKVASYFSLSRRLEIAAVEQALIQHEANLLQERHMLQQFAQGAGEITQGYRENLQALNPVIAQPQFATQEIAGIASFAAQETATSFGMQSRS